MALAAGNYLGTYRLLNIIRSTKTSQIWEAINDVQNRRYALKVMSAEQRLDAAELAMLKREFAIGQELDHPYVIKMHEMRQDRGTLYLAMDFFPAPNLKQWVQQGTEPLVPQVAVIVKRMTESLGYLHGQGWVHRDIKPDNFLVDPSGEVRLIDFALGLKQRGFFGRLFSGKSKIQGTRSYMSPEQIRGQTVDARSDIYSLGCTVYELIGGKPPFTGANTQQLLTRHLKSPPPPLEAQNANVSRDFSQLLRKMLEKEPKDRPQSCAEVLRELSQIKVFRPGAAQTVAAGRQGPVESE